MTRAYRAGDSIEDFCRACRMDRMHTVVASDQAGAPLRVVCGFCRSEHNYRGGPRIASAAAPAAAGTAPRAAAARPERQPFPLVSERERTFPTVSTTPGPDNDAPDLELLLRRIIREEAGVSAVTPSERWRGGQLVLRPGNATQEKSWPIETFFHKVVMIRNRLRTLEQQVNAADMPDDAKVKLQAYITGCYGSLTSFNVLFADEEDQFKGGAE